MARQKRPEGEIHITPKQQVLLDYLAANDVADGVTADDVRHLFEGEILTARSILHRLAEMRLIRKKIIRRKDVWDGHTLSRPVAVFYPRPPTGDSDT